MFPSQMRNRRWLAVLVMLFQIAGARAVPTKPGPQARKTPVKTATTFIEGTIYDERTKQPIKDAEIRFNGNSGFTEDVISDARGHYRFNGVTAGSPYSLWVRTDECSSRYLSGSGLPKSGVRKDIALAPNGVVRGTVRNQNGQPIANARVTLEWGEDWREIEIPLDTDKNGNFIADDVDAAPVANLKGTPYFVSVSHPDYSVIHTRCLVRPRYTSSDESLLPSLRMAPRAVLQGRVSSAGRPLQGAGIYLTANSGYEEDGSLMGSDKNGFFSGKINAPATYEVTMQGKRTAPVTRKIKVVPGQVVTLRQDLPGPGAIAGRVIDTRGRPVPKATVELLDAQEVSPMSDTVRTGCDGTYKFSGLVPLQIYVVRATMPTAPVELAYPQARVRVMPGKTARGDLRGDLIAPRCRIVAPAKGAVVKGRIAIRIMAADNQGVDSFDLDVDGAPIHPSASVESFIVSRTERNQIARRIDQTVFWNSAKTTNGVHKLRVALYDLCGNRIVRVVQIKVRNAKPHVPRRT